jgi:hypothetical protein
MQTTMAKVNGLTRSVRTHIRRQKAIIRRKNASPEERQKQIAELYARFRNEPGK